MVVRRSRARIIRNPSARVVVVWPGARSSISMPPSFGNGRRHCIRTGLQYSCQQPRDGGTKNKLNLDKTPHKTPSTLLPRCSSRCSTAAAAPPLLHGAPLCAAPPFNDTTVITTTAPRLNSSSASSFVSFQNKTLIAILNAEQHATALPGSQEGLSFIGPVRACTSSGQQRVSSPSAARLVCACASHLLLIRPVVTFCFFAVQRPCLKLGPSRRRRRRRVPERAQAQYAAQ